MYKRSRRNRTDVTRSDPENSEHLENLDIHIISYFDNFDNFETGFVLESLESIVPLEGEAACGNGSFFRSACAPLSIPRPGPGPGPAKFLAPKVVHHRWDPHSPDSGMATGMAMHWAMHGRRHAPFH